MKARVFFYALVLAVVSAAVLSATPMVDGKAYIAEYDAYTVHAGGGVVLYWFDEYHSAAGYAEFFGPDIDDEESSDRIAALSRAARNRIFGLILPHAVPLALSFLGMITGILIARFRKKNKNWLKIHRPIGYVSAAPILGRGLTKWKAGRTPGMKMTHRIVGRLAVLCMAATIVFGLLEIF